MCFWLKEFPTNNYELSNGKFSLFSVARCFQSFGIQKTLGIEFSASAWAKLFAIFFDFMSCESASYEKRPAPK